MQDLHAGLQRLGRLGQFRLHQLLDVDRPLHAAQVKPPLSTNRPSVAEVGEVFSEESDGLVGFVCVHELVSGAFERKRRGRRPGVPKPIESSGLFATAVHTSSNNIGRPLSLIATTSATLPSRLIIAFRLWMSCGVMGAEMLSAGSEPSSRPAWRLSERFVGDDSPVERAENEAW